MQSLGQQESESGLNCNSPRKLNSHQGLARRMPEDL